MMRGVLEVNGAPDAPNRSVAPEMKHNCEASYRALRIEMLKPEMKHVWKLRIGASASSRAVKNP